MRGWLLILCGSIVAACGNGQAAPTGPTPAAPPSARAGAEPGCAEVQIGLDLRSLPVGTSESGVDLFVGAQSDEIRRLAPQDAPTTFFVTPGVAWLRVVFRAQTRERALAACRQTTDAYLPTAPRLAGSMESGTTVGPCGECGVPTE